ncbi:UDP-3-O-acyl-N-acetylglucosamine deacetylase [bacterium]|nr:UDP-3-O-acyl-N-acetylglucosamine deacetylase [bacterium]
MASFDNGYQRTLRKAISCSGIGLHSGEKVQMSIYPSDVDSGIVFKRTDLNGNSHEVFATANNVRDVSFATKLGNNGAEVHTVEHLLGVFNGLGIDNAVIHVDKNELPILDGSGSPIVYLIKEAGIKTQLSKRNYLKIKEPIEVVDNDKFIKVVPSEELQVSYFIDFNHPVLKKQSFSFTYNKISFINNIAPARTFTFLKEVNYLRNIGLAKGGSLDNAIVVGDDDILNDHLRFEDEFVRHKVLDLLGDLVLLGKPLIGHVIAYKAGHSLHVQLVKKILDKNDAWFIV